MKKVRKWDRILAVAIHPIVCICFCQFLILDFYDMGPVLPDWWRHKSLVSLGSFVCLSSVSVYIFLKISQGEQTEETEDCLACPMLVDRTGLSILNSLTDDVIIRGSLLI